MTRPPLGRIEKDGTDSLRSRLQPERQRLAALDVSGLDDLIDQATDEKPERRLTLDHFALTLDFCLENEKASGRKMTLTEYTEERVMHWLLNQWQSNDWRGHLRIELSEQHPRAFPGLSNLKLRETLRLSDYPAFEERVRYVIAEFGEDWAAVPSVEEGR